jgi:hypothetical protein
VFISDTTGEAASPFAKFQNTGLSVAATVVARLRTQCRGSDQAQGTGHRGQTQRTPPSTAQHHRPVGQLTDFPAPMKLMTPACTASSCFFFSASAEMIVTFTAPRLACISSAAVTENAR